MAALRTRFAICVFLAMAASPVAADNIAETVPEVTGRAVVAGGGPDRAFAIDPAKNRASRYDGLGNVQHVAVGPQPRFIVRDQGFGNVYVSNAGDGSLSIVKEESLAVSTLPINASGPLAVGEHGEVYVLDRVPNGGVVVVDPTARTWFRISVGPTVATGFTLGGGRLYVSVPAGGAGEVLVFAQSSSAPPIARIPVAGYPGQLAYNHANNKVYAALQVQGGPPVIAAIDAATHATQSITVPGIPNGYTTRALAANSGTNQVYAGYLNQLVLIDGATHNLTTIPTGDVVSISADGINRRTFVLDSTGTLTMVEGDTKRVEALSIPGESFDVASSYRARGAFVIGSAMTRVYSPGSEYVPTGINAQNLWWAQNGAESGWGIHMTHQGETLFATWFTYDAAGRGTWLVISDAKRDVRNLYSGTVYRTTGPSFGAAAFDPARVTRTAVGSAIIDIGNTDNASITATIDGVTVRKALSRQVFAFPAPTCSQSTGVGVIPNYQDLWWNASESGWGLNIAHQADILFVTWFTYDGSGSPMWLVGSNVAKTGNATYSGTLYRTSGPPLAASPWDASRVSRMPAGTATLSFVDNDNGTFAYSVDGVSRTKSITRQRFASPATHCR